MGASPSSPTLIQSVQRALRLVEIIGEHEGRARAKEIARSAGLPLATTYHLLRTCAYEGWLQRLDDGSWVLGHRFDQSRGQGAAARRVAHARPALEWLRDTVGGAVYLAGYIDGEVVVTEIVDSARAPRIDLWVGVHDAAHATAVGKSILGQLTAAERADYLDRHPLHDLTPRTVVDPRRLRLAAADGVSVDDGEYALGVGCLAAAVGTAATGGTAAPAGTAAAAGTGSDIAAVGVVASPGRVQQPGLRRTVLTAAGRVSRALALG